MGVLALLLAILLLLLTVSACAMTLVHLHQTNTLLAPPPRLNKRHILLKVAVELLLLVLMSLLPLLALPTLKKPLLPQLLLLSAHQRSQRPCRFCCRRCCHDLPLLRPFCTKKSPIKEINFNFIKK